MYGLKQDSMKWYAKLANASQSKGYHHSPNDYSLFLKKDNKSIVIIIVYVDDNLVEITSLKEFLNDTFQIKDLGNIGYFLGSEFNKTNGRMVIYQQKYIRGLRDLYSIDS